MQDRDNALGLSRHALLMVLCCAIPLALIAAVSLFRIDLGALGSWAIILLCPLLHLFMMRGMHQHNRGSHGQQACQANEAAQNREVVADVATEAAALPAARR